MRLLPGYFFFSCARGNGKAVHQERDWAKGVSEICYSESRSEARVETRRHGGFSLQVQHFQNRR